jgi:hypothetical protein
MNEKELKREAIQLTYAWLLSSGITLLLAIGLLIYAGYSNSLLLALVVLLILGVFMSCLVPSIILIILLQLMRKK